MLPPALHYHWGEAALARSLGQKLGCISTFYSTACGGWAAFSSVLPQVPPDMLYPLPKTFLL